MEFRVFHDSIDTLAKHFKINVVKKFTASLQLSVSLRFVALASNEGSESHGNSHST